MKKIIASVGASLFFLGATSASLAATWRPLVNTLDTVPGSTTTKFVRYSAPSINGLLTAVFRAEGADGSAGVYARNLNPVSAAKGPLITIAQSGGIVPQPNNLGALFDDFSDFPRIDKSASSISLVGLHGPVWTPAPPQLGKSGIFVTDIKKTPLSLTTAVSQLGSLQGFSKWQVPNAPAGTTFDRVTYASNRTIAGVLHVVFRGEYQDGGPQHGVYYRAMDPANTSPIYSLRNTKTSLIPGLANTLFGYLSPPSAGGYDTAALIGLDKPIVWTSTQNPTWGAVSKMHLTKNAYFPSYVKLGYKVPGVSGAAYFTRFGDTVSWNGRYILFWGSWGTAFKPVKMVCPTEGDPEAIQSCNAKYQTTPTPVMQVPVNQAIVIFDDRPKTSRLIDRTNGTGDDFVFWKYSSADQTWHPSIQLALDSEANSLPSPQTWVAFKMRKGVIGPADGLWSSFSDHIYLTVGLNAKTDLLATGTTDGIVLDPKATGMKVVELELEREGLRNKILGVQARMQNLAGSGGLAGIYLSKIVP